MNRTARAIFKSGTARMFVLRAGNDRLGWDQDRLAGRGLSVHQAVQQLRRLVADAIRVVVTLDSGTGASRRSADRCHTQDGYFLGTLTPAASQARKSRMLSCPR